MSKPPEPFLKFDRRLRWVDTSKIEPNEHNPRENISKHEVSDIKASILEMGGILVPLVVIEKSENEYVLLDGERRWRASVELAKEYPLSGFEKVPVNIVRAPLDKKANIRVMFNIHMERKQWSTGAIAEAIADLLETTDSSNKDIAEMLHVSEPEIRLARHFNRMPEDIKQRSLNEDIHEYYLIFLSQSLRTVERRYPELIEKYGFDEIVHKFIRKVDKGKVKNADEFRLISKMITKCTNYQVRELFIEYFDEMMKNDSYTPEEANEDLDIQLGSKIDDLFILNSRKYRKNLEQYHENILARSIPVPSNIYKLLQDISEKLSALLKI